MPNWCENDLLIRGKKEELERFLGFAKGEGDQLFDFNKFIPYPDEFAKQDKAAAEFMGEWKDRPKDGFNSGGYEWCIRNWGTKWNADDVRVGEIEDFGGDQSEVTTHFSTAWSPPSPVIGAASDQFPQLEFTLTYFECGAAFNGILQLKAGQELACESGPYFGNRGG